MSTPTTADSQGESLWPLYQPCTVLRKWGRGGSGAPSCCMQEELKVLREKGFEEDSYAYLACMAVARDARRSGAATALLGAAERMAGKWQQNFVLLHTFADNFPGLRLYHANG